MANKGWFTRFLERAGNSLGGATPLAPIDAGYGAAWWGTAADDGFGRNTGRLPLVAAAHLPVF